MDDPLDFEVQDDLIKPPTSPNIKKRNNIIGLDDLLKDHYKEQEKLLEKENKEAKKKDKEKAKEKNYDDDDHDYDDDDEDGREAQLTRIIENCNNQIIEFGGQEIQVWGVKVFGEQKTFPSLDSHQDLGSCNLIQSFLNNKLNSVVELAADEGHSFIEGLLVNGWLPKLAFHCGHLEKTIALWSFNSMLYSSKEELQNACSDFWCSILSSGKEGNEFRVKVDWFPKYTDLRSALDAYGFLFKFSPSATDGCESLDSSDSGGPPQNIRAWVIFVTSCCLIRSKKVIFSTIEAEEIVEVIICLFLDRQFLGLLVLLNDCVEAAVNYFTDQEWCSSCENIAKFIASRVSKDLNCIQTIECVSEVNSRCKQLRSTIANQTLLSCFDGRTSNGEEILKSLDTVNFKDKTCDFFKMYIHLVLTKNWILSSNAFAEDNPVIYEMFCNFLRRCSRLISGTDPRPYASKVRHTAAYLLHFYIKND